MLMAIKTVTKIGGGDIETSLKQEVDVLKNLRHDNIVQLYGCLVVGGDSLWILMDLCEYGSARDVLKKQPGGCFSEVGVLSIMSPVLQGLEYLHSKSILHRYKEKEEEREEKETKRNEKTKGNEKKES